MLTFWVIEAPISAMANELADELNKGKPVVARKRPLQGRDDVRPLWVADSTGGCNTPTACAVFSVLHPPVESAIVRCHSRNALADCI